MVLDKTNFLFHEKYSSHLEHKIGKQKACYIRNFVFLNNSLKVVGAKFVLPLNISVARICWFLMRIGTGLIFQRMILLWVRLNYATTHHHHSPPAKIYPPLPTISQNTSTTTYHFPKNGPPPRKSQNIFIYNLL